MIKKKYNPRFDVPQLNSAAKDLVRKIGVSLSPLTTICVASCNPQKLILRVREGFCIPEGCPVACIPRHHFLNASVLGDSPHALLLPTQEEISTALGSKHMGIEQHVLLALYVASQLCLEDFAADPLKRWFQMQCRMVQPNEQTVKEFKPIWFDLSEHFTVPSFPAFVSAMQYVLSAALLANREESPSIPVKDTDLAGTPDVLPGHTLCLAPVIDLALHRDEQRTNTKLVFVDHKAMCDVYRSGPLYGVHHMIARGDSDFAVLLASSPIRGVNPVTLC